MKSNNDMANFDQAICKLFSDIIQQDELNIRVLFFIVNCEKKKMTITVKTLTNNIRVNRRVGIKNCKNKVVSFSNKEELVDRKTAEKIVDRLAYASLIYFDVQHPYKYIKLTSRGIQVAIYINKQRKKENKQ